LRSKSPESLIISCLLFRRAECPRDAMGLRSLEDRAARGRHHVERLTCEAEERDVIIFLVAKARNYHL